MGEATPDEMTNYSYVADRNVAWFMKPPSILPWPARELLEKYSGIEPQQVGKHIAGLRDRAWDTYPFPCIGSFDFLDFNLSQRNRLYPRLLFRLQGGQKFLDIGCCLGHDIRKLIFDGVPSSNVAGVELRAGFIDLGFELFRDKDKFEGRMLPGSITEDGEPWVQLEGQFDVVNFGMVFHCLTWDEQIQALGRALDALNGQKGNSVIGICVGTLDGRLENWTGKTVPAHNEETFEKLVREFEEKTATKWEVQVELDTGFCMWDGKYEWLGPRVRRCVFELTRLE
ncbi:hypothetical protein OQA88_8292 [Cercophora sp. LCS_1]